MNKRGSSGSQVVLTDTATLSVIGHGQDQLDLPGPVRLFERTDVIVDVDGVNDEFDLLFRRFDRRASLAGR